MTFVKIGVLFLVLHLSSLMLGVNEVSQMKTTELLFQRNSFKEKQNSLLEKVIHSATTDAMIYVNNHSEYGIVYGEREMTSSESEIVKSFLKGKPYDATFKIQSKKETFVLSSKTLVISYNDKIEFGPLVGYHVKDEQLEIILFGPVVRIIYRSPFKESVINFEKIQAEFRNIYANGIKREFDKFFKN